MSDAGAVSAAERAAEWCLGDAPGWLSGLCDESGERPNPEVVETLAVIIREAQKAAADARDREWEARLANKHLPLRNVIEIRDAADLLIRHLAGGVGVLPLPGEGE